MRRAFEFPVQYLMVVLGLVTPAVGGSAPNPPGNANPSTETADQTMVLFKAPAIGPIEVPDDPPAPPRPVNQQTVSPAGTITFNGFTSVQVNVDANGNNIVGDAANESSIAVDPTRPNRMAIGWRQFDSVSNNFRQAGWGNSRDGGRTWRFPGVIEPGVFRSDPVLRADRNGSFFYNSLTFEDGVGYWCKVFKSSDGGETWDDGVYAYGGDKGWMAIDRTGGIGDGNIYFAWDYAGCCGNDWFNRSTDGGASFEVPVPIPEQPIWGLTTVGPDGEVYIAGRRNSTNTQFVVAKSTTIRNPLNPLGFDFAVQVDMGGVHRYALGTGPNPGGLHGNVCVATDHSSSATRGYVYVLASVDPPGNDPMDVHIIRSIDGGQNWGAPVRVNDDAVGTNAWQWFAAMDVAPNGRIDVVWNDTRGDPGGVASQLYYAYSTNAGQTFSTNVAVGPAFDPLIGWPNQNKLGDYYDMTSDLVGAHVAYASTYNGEQDVYYVRIGDYDCNNNGVGDAADIAGGASDSNANGIPDECELEVVPATSATGLLAMAAALVVAGALVSVKSRTGSRYSKMQRAKSWTTFPCAGLEARRCGVIVPPTLRHLW